MFTSIVCMVVMSAASPPSESEMQRQEEPAAADYHEFSCAHNALYLLLKLLKRPATLEEVKSRLQVGENGECSMTELEEAAASFGVSLAGRRLSGKDFAEVDVPLIVLLQNPNDLHGHYLVSRWIDGEQTIQALDPPKEPYLVPKTDVLGYEGPALACLVPIDRQASALRGIGALALGLSAVAILVIAWQFGGFSRSFRLRRSSVA